MRPRFSLAVVIGLLLVGLVLAEPIPVLTANGRVEKVEKNLLIVQPRAATGQFGKSVRLQLTGTSKITTLTAQTRGGKQVLVQRDTDAKDLKPRQPIAVIYATGKDGAILLSAVVQDAEK
jgi:hypothetical protein